MYLSGKADEYPTSMPALTNYPVATIGSNADDNGKYIMTTKIMVVALAVLFAVVFFVICFHIYAKWVWSTSSGHPPASLSFWPLRWRRTRASQVILDADVLDLNLGVGLGKAAVEALPTFKFKESTEIGPLECAICLGQFQEDELGRELPNCNHRFHLECIDMWLYSHSTCPLCRDILEPRDEEDEEASISLNLESASIQVFRTERLSAARRLQPGEQPAPRRLQPEEHEEHSLVAESEHGGEQDTANKRADAIPANVLFWGNLMQQQGAHSRFLNNSRPAHIAIAVDFDMGTSPPVVEQQSSLQNHDTFSHSNNSL